MSAWRRVSTEQPCCNSKEAATAASRAFTSMAVPCLAVLRINFSEGAVGKATDPGRIPDPFVLEGQELVSAAVGKRLARHVTHPRGPQPFN